MNREQLEQEAQRSQAMQAELVARLTRAIQTDGTVDPWEWLRLRRASSPTELGHGVAHPSFCVIAQGSKEILLGENRYRYDSAHYLIATVELPIASHIVEASPEQPYLGIILKLDPGLVGSVLVEAGQITPRRHAPMTAIHVSPLDVGLLDTVVRLVRLLDSPLEARLLAPLIKREIICRLLLGEQGSRLSQIAALGDATHRIAEAIHWLRRNFDQPLRIEVIAHEFGMSVSGFHHHFRALTAMSPLQYQKQLRLQEARRLMLSEGFDATTAGYNVGYGNAVQFTREYKRLFGAPPLRDIKQLRTAASESAAEF
ncbi:MAG: AraC family transcriptional regulator [Caldilineaceae bacterium]